ncbi:hypothetical protein [Halorubellus sp. PRR65]|uniref:hypothetical protein n=1 Tax=Halorubellus sp. PRR65 TaxID=3098148 RepID=UPI002B25DFC3|nr:hypothetical protein [Halorubellus sp. PRR65]
MTGHALLDTPSGNAVVVALDHGLSLGAPEEFAYPAATLDHVLAGEPDTVLVGPHFARRDSDRIERVGIETILTADVVT